MRVVFSLRAYTSVLAETTEKIRTETGGLFLGAYKDETWYVVEAIDPGPKSIFEIAYFEYDREYTQHLIRKIANLYAARLELIGLWHRHPGSFDVFSSTDDDTNTKYAQLNEYGAISALVNIDPSFRITMYHVSRPCKYSKIMYEVGDELFPAGLLTFKEPSAFETLMRRISSPGNTTPNAVDGYHKSASFARFLQIITPYLSDYLCEDLVAETSLDEQKVRELIINELFDDITFFSDDAGIEVTVLQREKCIVITQEAIEGITRLYFAYSEKNEQVVFEYGGKSYCYKAGLLKELFHKAIEDKQQKLAQSVQLSEVAGAKGRGGLNTFLRLLIGSKNGGIDDEQH